MSSTPEVTALESLADSLLATARDAPAGRASQLIHGGSGAALRQVVMALTAGHGLGEHDSPDDATLQVLRGRVRLAGSTASREMAAGQIADIPRERHSLAALEDSVVLLTTLTLPR